MNELNLKIRLFDAGKIAVPLKHQEGCDLNLQPNFLIIDNIFEFSTQKVYSLQGNLEEMEVMNSYMKLVYREILPEENGRGMEIREVLMDNIGNIFIPEDYVPVFKNHQRMIGYEQVLNTFLPMFKFRGCLKSFKLEYDKQASLDYLANVELQKNPPQPVQEEEPIIEEPPITE